MQGISSHSKQMAPEIVPEEELCFSPRTPVRNTAPRWLLGLGRGPAPNFSLEQNNNQAAQPASTSSTTVQAQPSCSPQTKEPAPEPPSDIIYNTFQPSAHLPSSVTSPSLARPATSSSSYANAIPAKAHNGSNVSIKKEKFEFAVPVGRPKAFPKTPASKQERMMQQTKGIAAALKNAASIPIPCSPEVGINLKFINFMF